MHQFSPTREPVRRELMAALLLGSEEVVETTTPDLSGMRLDHDGRQANSPPVHQHVHTVGHHRSEKHHLMGEFDPDLFKKRFVMTTVDDLSQN